MAEYEAVESKLEEIEAELKRVGFWREEPLPEEAYNFSMAFALDTMPFAWWLEFVFIPRVRGIIAEKGKFPSSSNVGAQATREYDTENDASQLVILLNEFDDL
ncbi:MAG: YqcC family protein, partial [Chloroflexia bacterium]